MNISLVLGTISSYKESEADAMPAPAPAISSSPAALRT